MAHGIPVVSTSAGAEGVPVESGKHVLIADTARAFADACVRCMHDGAMGRAMANAAREMAVDSYSWGSATQKLLDIYSEIIAAKNSNR
ncbi:MAG: glycosyltransferase [Chlorobi bacterium OLB6]|nr:MAG: glycosyltransferase [Chlorobi bacterium OLB6]